LILRFIQEKLSGKVGRIFQLNKLLNLFRLANDVVTSEPIVCKVTTASDFSSRDYDKLAVPNVTKMSADKIKLAKPDVLKISTDKTKLLNQTIELLLNQQFLKLKPIRSNSLNQRFLVLEKINSN